MGNTKKAPAPPKGDRILQPAAQGAGKQSRAYIVIDGVQWTSEPATSPEHANQINRQAEAFVAHK